MPVTRSCRIIRCAVMVVALLGAWYVSSSFTILTVIGTGRMPYAIAAHPVVDAYIAPVDWYIFESEWPGSHRCFRAMLWARKVSNKPG